MYKTLTVTEVVEIVKGFKKFILESKEPVDYKPGQYLTLVNFSNKEEIRRSYSIASAPVLGEPLCIGVKRIQNGFFSRQLSDETPSGSEIVTIGAGGLFILPDNIQDFNQIVFFAAGSGITPIYSLLKTVLYAHPGLVAVLIYSNTSEDTAIFLTELKSLEDQFGERFLIKLIFSNDRDLRKAHLHREFLMELITEVTRFEPKKCLFYICGPQAYMRMCTYTLQAMGFPKGNLKRENFIIQKAAALRPPPLDMQPHLVTVYLWGTKYQFLVSYPDSILRAAKKENIQLPYSCEAGSCGNCIAKCKSGEIWLANNEVLTESDLDRGLTLTCVAHPVRGDIVLEIG